MDFNDPELAWRVWTWMEATGWRWPPDVLLRQPQALMEDLMTISGMSAEIKEQLDA